MPVLVIVFIFVAAIVLGPIAIGVTYCLRKERAVNKSELQELRNDIAEIKLDIGEIKEQFADFIIKTH